MPERKSGLKTELAFSEAENIGTVRLLGKVTALKLRAKKGTEMLRDAAATAEVLFRIAQSESFAITRGLSVAEQSDFGARLIVAVCTRLWKHHAKLAECDWAIRAAPLAALTGYPSLTERLVSSLVNLPIDRAGFLLGRLYTSLLPEDRRKSLGAYYTPPPIAERLLNLVSLSGFDWAKGKIIDPACGGAAFLVPLARKLLKASSTGSVEKKLAEIENRLSGIELDPAAAWLSAFLLDVETLSLCVSAGRPLRSIVRVGDTLLSDSVENYDLVVGNPPYGKVGLSEEQRTRFKASLFGHANLYALFTHLAVGLAKPGGLIAYVTPTSFLGGEYFKNLRSMLSVSAPVRRVDFVTAREGIFDNVLQETMLTIFGKVPQPFRSPVQVSSVECAPTDEARITSVGATETPPPGGGSVVITENRAGQCTDSWVFPNETSPKRLWLWRLDRATCLEPAQRTTARGL